MFFWNTPIRLLEAKYILRQRRCGFGSQQRSSLRLAGSKSSIRPENRWTRITRTQISPVVRFCRFHCRGSDQEPTRWPGMLCHSIRMRPTAISHSRFSGKPHLSAQRLGEPDQFVCQSFDAADDFLVDDVVAVETVN